MRFSFRDYALAILHLTALKSKSAEAESSVSRLNFVLEALEDTER